MIFNTYGEQKNSVNGITLVSAGHIFAKKGREILRPNGRDDWLLFFVAKEEETFYFENVKICKAGGFVLFAPGEPQHHIYKGDKTAEFYYVHFKCDALPDNINLKTRKVYNLSFTPYTSTAYGAEEISAVRFFTWTDSDMEILLDNTFAGGIESSDSESEGGSDIDGPAYGDNESDFGDGNVISGGGKDYDDDAWQNGNE